VVGPAAGDVAVLAVESPVVVADDEGLTVDVGEGSVVSTDGSLPSLNAAAKVPMQQHSTSSGATERIRTLGKGSLNRPGRVGSFTAP